MDKDLWELHSQKSEDCFWTFTFYYEIPEVPRYDNITIHKSGYDNITMLKSGYDIITMLKSGYDIITIN